MNKAHNILSAAIGGLLAMGLATGNAVAADMKMEKCFGIAKAGKNDCSSKAAGHSCAGQASQSSNRSDFVAVPAGTCSKIVNGSTKPASGAM